MLLWRFSCYVSASGRCDVQTTVDSYDDDSLAAFSAAIRYLAVAPMDHWNEPHARKIAGKKKLHEVRYKANRRATRALGFFSPGDNLFTITLICYHKGNVYTPKDAIDTAARRAAEIQDGAARVAALQVDGEDFPPDEE